MTKKMPYRNDTSLHVTGHDAVLCDRLRRHVAAYRDRLAGRDAAGPGAVGRDAAGPGAAGPGA